MNSWRPRCYSSNWAENDFCGGWPPLRHFFCQKMANEDASLLFTVPSGTTSLKKQSFFFTSSPNTREDLLACPAIALCEGGWRRSLCSLVKPLISFACEVFPLSRVMMVLFYFFIRDDSSKVIHFWNHQKHLLHLQTLVIGSILWSDNKNSFLYGNSENILLYSIILFGGVLTL